VRYPGSLAPVRHRGFRLFLAGRMVSFLGSSMAPIALAFAVLDLSGSATELGIVLAARQIPMILLLLVGGVIADRLPRHVVLVVSHLGAFLTQGTAAALLLSGHASVGALAVVEALNGSLSAFTFPAMQGVIPQVAPAEHLQQANALLGLVRNSVFTAGPALGGVLVATAGSGWAIAVDAASYAIAAAVFSRLALPHGDRLAAPNMLRELREGWGEFVSRTWLWVIVVAFGVLNAIQAGALFTLGPVVANATIGRAAWGIALAALAAGQFLGTVALLRLRFRFMLRAGMLGILALAPPIAVLGLAPHALPLIVLSLFAGVGSEIFGIGWETSLQQHVPIDKLSRVSSYDALGSFVAMPVGQLLAGPLAAALGLRQVLVGGAVLYVVVALATVAVPSVRNLQRADQPLPVQSPA
jgi:MFS family permease